MALKSTDGAILWLMKKTAESFNQGASMPEAISFLGAATVILAMGEGRRAAAAINAQLGA